MVVKEESINETEFDELSNNEEEHETTDLSDISLKDRPIIIDYVDYPIELLKNLAERGDLVLRPSYQRDDVWNSLKKSKLVESILLNVPIPIVYLAEEEDGIYSVIDGQQRLTALIKFLSNDFKLRDGGLNAYKEYANHKFKMLEKPVQRKLLQSKIRCVVIKKESHPDIKFEIFERINTGSEKLNAQEIRNCIYRGTLNDLLIEITEDKEFSSVGIPLNKQKRMDAQELALRFFALSSQYHLYKSSLKRFLNDYMRDNKNLPKDKLNQLKDAFNKSLSLSKSVFGKNVFRRFSRGNDNEPNGKWEEIFNKAIFDVVMIGFLPYEKREIIPNADVIREEFINLMASDETFIDYTFMQGTSDKKKLIGRIDIWKAKLREILLESNDNSNRLFSRSLKEELFNQNSTCGICNQKIMLIDDAAIDHVLPYSQGGQTTLTNARLTHRYCNLRKGRNMY